MNPDRAVTTPAIEASVRQRRRRNFLLAGLIAAIPPAIGCNPFTIPYLLMGMPESKIEPAFGKFEEKTVVVIPFIGAATHFNFASVDTELSELVVNLLRQNVEEIKVVEPQRVWEWRDEHTGWQLRDVGEAFKADYVVYLEISKFTLFEDRSPTLYRGKADILVEVADMHDDGRVVWKQYHQSQYPLNRPIPAADMMQPRFQQMFLERLAEEIGRYFYAHVHGQDVKDW